MNILIIYFLCVVDNVVCVVEDDVCVDNAVSVLEDVVVDNVVCVVGNFFTNLDPSSHKISSITKS